jgi:hypothetical protein
VLGIDGRQMHVDQANFVFGVKQIDRSRYEFVTGDVYATDLSAEGPFEIALCLGFLYHVSDPATLIEKIGELKEPCLLELRGRPRLPLRWPSGILLCEGPRPPARDRGRVGASHRAPPSLGRGQVACLDGERRHASTSARCPSPHGR